MSVTANAPDSAGRVHERRENLALLYQGVLTAVVRVQSGRQPIADASSFRKRMKDVLDQIGREALRAGYETQDVAEANYAIVAFLDEAVLNSNDPSKTQWQSVQAELYEKAVAGEIFHERLDAMRGRRDSVVLADILEVYYLCLLLGYRGRYALAGEAELQHIMDELWRRIRSVRGFDEALSPDVLPVSVSAPTSPKASTSSQMFLWTAGAIGLTLLLWLVLKLLLHFQAQEAASAIQRLQVP